MCNGIKEDLAGHHYSINGLEVACLAFYFGPLKSLTKWISALYETRNSLRRGRAKR